MIAVRCILETAIEQKPERDSKEAKVGILVFFMLQNALTPGRICL